MLFIMNSKFKSIVLNQAMNLGWGTSLYCLDDASLLYFLNENLFEHIAPLIV